MDIEYELNRIEEDLTDLNSQIDEKIEIIQSNDKTLKEKLEAFEDLRAIPNQINEYSSKIRDIISKKDDVYEIEKVFEIEENLNGKISELTNKLYNNNLMNDSVNTIINDYLTKLRKAEIHANKLIHSFARGISQFKNISDELNELVTEYDNLKTQSNEIKSIIDKYSTNFYTISSSELETRITNLRFKIREIKKQQVTQYNNMVTVLNNRIAALKNNLNGLPEELISKINELPNSFDLCNIEIRQYNQTNYLDSLDYSGLRKLLMLTSKLEEQKQGLQPQMPDLDGQNDGNSGDTSENDQEQTVTPFEELNAELENIRNDLETKLALGPLTEGELKEFENRIASFENKLASHNLSQEDYEKLIAKLNEIKGNLPQKLNNGENLGFKEYDDQANDLKERLNKFNNEQLDPALAAKEITEKELENLTKQLTEIEKDVNNLKETIENNKNSLSEEQYNNLSKKISTLTDEISKTKEKLKNHQQLQKEGFFDKLDGTLKGLEDGITAFEQEIAKANDPIPKEQRSKLEQMQKKLEDEIIKIEEEIEKHKDEDKEKYQSSIDRLNKCKERLEEAKNKYRSKCPFLVKATRKATEFYKKHKKAILIVGGLVAIALTLVAGHFCIPYIMQGNILIANKIAALRPLLLGMNNGLGNLINATFVTNANGGFWRLASGAFLNSQSGTFSLLKGIALNATGNAITGLPLGALATAIIMDLRKNKKKQQKQEQKNIQIQEQNIEEENEEKTAEEENLEQEGKRKRRR